LRVNRREVEEGEDLDDDGWKRGEKDVRKMKVKIWRQKAVDREEWASEIMEAKDVRGP
jgi:hypothetical protein